MQTHKLFSSLLLTGCLATAGCASLRSHPSDQTLDQAPDIGEAPSPDASTTDSGVTPSMVQEPKAPLAESIAPQSQPPAIAPLQSAPTVPAVPMVPTLPSALSTLSTP